MFDAVVKAVNDLADVGDDELRGALKQMWANDKFTFDPLSSIIAGAYFMTPQVKELIGYPGQHRDPAGLEDAANELETGILDPVLERGRSTSRPPANETTASARDTIPATLPALAAQHRIR